MQPHAAMSEVDRLSIMLLCAGIGGSKYRNKQVFAWLRMLARNKTILGGIGTGAYALASVCRPAGRISLQLTSGGI